MNILVVEDEILIADKLCQQLTELGYQCVEPALNYSEAIQSLKSNQLDLIFLDINLGGQKTGIDVAHEINKDFHLPFIFLTAYQDQRTLESIKETRPWGYLLKPYKPEDLRPAIEIALSNYTKANDGKQQWMRMWEQLTESERKVVYHIALGKSTSEIGDALFVSPATIKKHRHNICEKLKLATSNNSLLFWALSHVDFINRSMDIKT